MKSRALPFRGREFSSGNCFDSGWYWNETTTTIIIIIIIIIIIKIIIIIVIIIIIIEEMVAIKTKEYLVDILDM